MGASDRQCANRPLWGLYRGDQVGGLGRSAHLINSYITSNINLIRPKCCLSLHRNKLHWTALTGVRGRLQHADIRLCATVAELFKSPVCFSQIRILHAVCTRRDLAKRRPLCFPPLRSHCFVVKLLIELANLFQMLRVNKRSTKGFAEEEARWPVIVDWRSRRDPGNWLSSGSVQSLESKL